MCSEVITSGIRLLIGAVLWSLLALPAAAHPGHGHHNDGSEVVAVAVAPVVHRDVRREAQAIATIATSAVLSGCCSCSGQSGCCSGFGCGLGMTCGATSCNPGTGAALVLGAVGLAPPAKAAPACRSGRLLAGDAPGPDDRPPRV